MPSGKRRPIAQLKRSHRASSSTAAGTGELRSSWSPGSLVAPVAWSRPAWPRGRRSGAGGSAAPSRQRRRSVAFSRRVRRSSIAVSPHVGGTVSCTGEPPPEAAHWPRPGRTSSYAGGGSYAGGESSCGATADGYVRADMWTARSNARVSGVANVTRSPSGFTGRCRWRGMGMRNSWSRSPGGRSSTPTK